MQRPGALTQPPYDTSLLGTVVGALHGYGIDATPAEAFVLSGHAFALNIHPDLCPSGPYCWDFHRCTGLFVNLGIEMRQLGVLPPQADRADKQRLEERVRSELDQGAACALLNLDHQLIAGSDDDGFVLAQPWGPEPPSTPARLTFGTWAECQTGPPVAFASFVPSRAASAAPLEEAVDLAVEAWRNPATVTEAPYGFGPDAYDRWLAALEGDALDEHGNWWNASVWSECRGFASRYFAAPPTSSAWLDGASAQVLSEQYEQVATRLRAVSDRTRPTADRRALVAEARELDTDCIERLDRLRTD